MAAGDWKWDKRRTQAAALVAEDKLSNEEIAATVGVTRQTLDNWKAREEFRARVSEIVTAYREAILTSGIADRVNRVRAQNERWQRMQRTLAARADFAKEMEESGESVAPGAEEGLMVRQIKMIGSGENAREIEEWATDTALLREIREIEKQAAIEVGQWTEKAEVKTEGAVAVKVIKGVSMDDL